MAIGNGAATRQSPEPDLILDSDDVLDIDFSQEVIAPLFNITAYGADFLVDGIVNRLKQNDIVVPRFDPESESQTGLRGFQRHFVWSKSQCDKFVESLLMGFPVPGIFLVQRPNNVLLVLDGQQRLATLYSFYEGLLKDRTFRLTFVQDMYKGMRYRDLPDDDRRRLDNSILHATILRQDKGEGAQQAVYQIFERINTGGTPLQPHEIRIALYGGNLIRLIRELNNVRSWRTLFGNPSMRFKDHELILRFLALYYAGDRYSRPMKGFLNDFVEEQQAPSEDLNEEYERRFRSTVEAIADGIGERAFRPIRPINAAVADSIMVGIAKRLDRGSVRDLAGLEAVYRELLADEDYRRAVDRSTADEESVRTRLAKAIAAFENVE